MSSFLRWKFILEVTHTHSVFPEDGSQVSDPGHHYRDDPGAWENDLIFLSINMSVALYSGITAQ